MNNLEAFAAVRDFVETGGDVLLAIAAVSFGMWFLMLERFWYFRWAHPGNVDRVEKIWKARADHRSWHAHVIRRLLITQVEVKLEKGLILIRSLVALCPMLGLIGTVTGMIEVFDVMAIAGSGNARGMAGGVSKATLPTMAGMVVAISGLLLSAQIERFVKSERQRVADRLEIVHM